MDNLNLKAVCNNVPLVVNRELAITNSSLEEINGVNLVFCNNCIMQDLEHWIEMQKGKTCDDVKVYVSHIQELLKSETEGKYKQLYAANSVKWSAPFKTYYDKF